MPKRLTPLLTELQVEIEGYARDYGLDPFPQVFEVVTYEEMNMVAAYGGFPKRYPHWRFGMEYERLSKSYTYGLSKIYELVINNNPCYAYLLDTNAEVDSKTVMAHVYGHNDFFKNNFSFAHTNRKMLDAMGNHSTRVRRLIDKVGLEPVEAFIDRCFSLENLIDPHAPYIRRVREETETDEAAERDPVHKLKVGREYMNSYINPDEFIAEQRQKAKAEREQAKRFPPEPRRDVLRFLLEHAPLEPWELDLLEIVREEAYYFAPQGQTKILNEGWATYWHSKIMTQKAVRDGEIIDYANAHAGVLSTSGRQLNPYKLGLELLRDIESRWDTGRFGKEFEECRNMDERRNWDRNLGIGREKIFEVRRHHNDVTFIDAFLTPEFCIDQKLFTFEWKEKGDRWEIISKAFREVKQKLLNMLTNFGQPMISVLDGNHENRGELLLVHRHEGVDLKHDHALDTLENLHALWRRPVHLHTFVEEKGVILSFDGTGHGQKPAEL